MISEIIQSVACDNYDDFFNMLTSYFHKCLCSVWDFMNWESNYEWTWRLETWLDSWGHFSFLLDSLYIYINPNHVPQFHHFSWFCLELLTRWNNHYTTSSSSFHQGRTPPYSVSFEANSYIANQSGMEIPTFSSLVKFVLLHPILWFEL